jgi:SIR2-like domain
MTTKRAAVPPVPEELARHVVARRCVAFIGAGFSAAIGMPNWGELLKSLVERAATASMQEGSDASMALCRAAIEQGEYQLAASMIARLLQPPEIASEIEEQFGLHKFQRAKGPQRRIMEERLAHLLAVPWQGILTTNYDKLIEVGLQQHSSTRAVEAIDAGKQLGTLLCQPASDRIFFAKIHGSTDIGRIVLSTEEYGEAYFRTPRMERFLSAIMLTSTVLFMGCSLDDEIVGLRRRLAAEFEGHIPLSYALVPQTKRNLRRREWLRSAARMQLIIYNDPTHSAFDCFLKNLSVRVQQMTVDPGLRADTATRLTSLSLPERWQELGEINQDLLRWMHRSDGSLRHHQLLELLDAPDGDRRKPSKLIADITGAERIYRLLFLVSAGCVIERLDDGQRLYVLDSDVQDYLDRTRV